MDLVAGIDLGATHTKFGLVNRKGELFTYQSIPTDTSVSYEEFFFALSQKIKKLDVPVNGDFNIIGVGVGTPTGNYINGTIENASNLNWPDHIPVAKLLENYFSLPVSVCNDANAAAIGELMFGVAKEKENFICTTLGTGLGSGIVLDGKLVLGKEGHAGELGHITAVPEGRDCACGRKGCLETYASATGIVRTVLGNSEDELKKSLLYRHKDNLDARKITEAASQGDEIALKAFDDTGKILGRKLADVVAILNIELIILSGGLAKSGELIRKPVKKYMNEHLLNIFQGSVEVKLSEISSKNTSILGTAAFMWLKIDNMSTFSNSTV